MKLKAKLVVNGVVLFECEGDEPKLVIDAVADQMKAASMARVVREPVLKVEAVVKKLDP